MCAAIVLPNMRLKVPEQFYKDGLEYTRLEGVHGAALEAHSALGLELGEHVVKHRHRVDRIR